MDELTIRSSDLLILENIDKFGGAAHSLPESLALSESEIRQRLSKFVDNGIIRVVGADTFELTASGHRLLDISQNRRQSSEIDIPTPVETVITGFELRPYEAEAIRRSYAFLRFWRSATTDEIIDGIYSEYPAGYQSSDEWWSNLVRDQLGVVPDVVPPTLGDTQWKYTGDFTGDEPDVDGRVHQLKSGRYSSVKQALERNSLNNDERSAIKATLTFLQNRGVATEQEIRTAVFTEYPAGYDNASVWWTNLVRDILAGLACIESLSSTAADNQIWRYHR